jgi:hypothetical protein
LFPHLWCSIIMWRMRTLLNQLRVSVSWTCNISSSHGF